MPMGGGANASPPAKVVPVGIAERPPPNTSVNHSTITALYDRCAKTTPFFARFEPFCGKSTQVPCPEWLAHEVAPFQSWPIVPNQA